MLARDVLPRYRTMASTSRPASPMSSANSLVCRLVTSSATLGAVASITPPSTSKSRVAPPVRRTARVCSATSSSSVETPKCFASVLFFILLPDANNSASMCTSSGAAGMSGVVFSAGIYQYCGVSRASVATTISLNVPSCSAATMPPFTNSSSAKKCTIMSLLLPPFLISLKRSRAVVRIRLRSASTACSSVMVVAIFTSGRNVLVGRVCTILSAACTICSREVLPGANWICIGVL